VLRPNRNNLSGGVTLLEVLATTVIVMIAAAVVVPSMVSTDRSCLKAGAMLLAANLEYARNVAVTHQTQINVTFDAVGNSFTVASANASAVLVDPITKQRSGAYTIAFASHSALSRLDLREANFDALASMAFSVTGEPVRYDPASPSDPEAATSGYVRIAIGTDLLYEVAVAAVTGKVTIREVSS